MLVTHAGRLVTHGRLLRAVWGTAYADEAHYVHVYVSQIRRKLAAADPAGELAGLIVAEPGVGYRVRAARTRTDPERSLSAAAVELAAASWGPGAMLGAWKSSIDRRSPDRASRPGERRPGAGVSAQRETRQVRAASRDRRRGPADPRSGSCVCSMANRRCAWSPSSTRWRRAPASCSSGGSGRAAAWTSSSGPREPEPLVSVRTELLHGRKPGDRRVRVERPDSRYFRYAGPGVVVARPAASEPAHRASGAPPSPRAGPCSGDRSPRPRRSSSGCRSGRRSRSSRATSCRRSPTPPRRACSPCSPRGPWPSPT